MRRLRFDQAKLLVVFTDGAEWIRQLCAWWPIPGLLILDLFHVKRRIWELARALYGEQTPQARQWAETQCLWMTPRLITVSSLQIPRIRHTLLPARR
jgi:hypothetical protein